MSDVTTGASDGAASATPSAPASERPTSIDAALDQSFTASLAASEPPAPDATTDQPVTDGDAPATAEPPADPAAPEIATPDDKQGPIPFKAHKQALENARTKAAEETQQRLVQEWETQVKPVLPYAQAITQDVQTGSVNGLAQVIEGYAQHPVLGPQVRSMFGRLLAQQKTQAPAQPAPDQRPEPDLEARQPDGSVITAYSAERSRELLAWEKRQMQQEMQQLVQPYEQMRQQQEQLALVQQIQTREWTNAKAQIDELRQSDPDFAPHEADVKKRMLENPKLSLDRAWALVYRDVVTPKKVAQSQQSWVSQAVKKSQGSSPDPAASAPAQPRTPRTVDEALDQAFAGLTGR